MTGWRASCIAQVSDAILWVPRFPVTDPQIQLALGESERGDSRGMDLASMPDRAFSQTQRLHINLASTRSHPPTRVRAYRRRLWRDCVIAELQQLSRDMHIRARLL
jgi:hypothetical protein